MANIKRLAYKLQTALAKKGEYYKINQVQNYSPLADRMITKYVLIKTKRIGDRNKNETVLETYQIADIVKYLAKVHGGEA